MFAHQTGPFPTNLTLKMPLARSPWKHSWVSDISLHAVWSLKCLLSIRIRATTVLRSQSHSAGFDLLIHWGTGWGWRGTRKKTSLFHTIHSMTGVNKQALRQINSSVDVYSRICQSPSTRNKDLGCLHSTWSPAFQRYREDVNFKKKAVAQVKPLKSPKNHKVK